MSNTEENYDENKETVEFYKIQLMEKEREISSFQAKFKKAEIKNNREIKQVKIAQEKAKNALKQERLKLDKMTKKTHQLAQQNNILQHRMTELKDEKDKEIQSVRNHYNHLKQEVRSYERILPTHTFLSELGATIEQLPTYEEVFINWKDQVQRYEQSETKFKAFKEESEEKIVMQQKVQESLKKKKNELQKQLRDDMTKLLEVESQVTTLQIERDEIAEKIDGLVQELQTAVETNEQLTESNKNLEAKLDQFITIHNTQIQAKEQEIRRITEEEMKKFEQEVDRVTQNYEIRENSHLQQLAFLQEEEIRLQQKNQRDKDKFEQTYRELYNEVENMKNQLQAQRDELIKQRAQADNLKGELADKSQECQLYLQKLGEYELKIEQLQNSINFNMEKLSDHKEKTNETLEEAQMLKKQMEGKVIGLQTENNELHSELMQRQNEIMMLNSEIQDLKNRGQRMNRSSFPAIFSPEEDFPLQIKIKKAESTYETENIIFEQVPVPINNMQTLQVEPRSRKLSSFSQGSIERERKLSNIFTQDQFDQKVKVEYQNIKKQLQEKFTIEIEQKNKIIGDKQKQYEEKKLKIEEEFNEQIKTLKKQIQGLQFDVKKMERDSQGDKEKLEDELGKSKKLCEMIKTEKDAIEQSYIAHVQESKRDKQGIVNFKNTIKQLEKNIKELNRSKEQLQIQVKQLKKYKQKIQAKELKNDKSLLNSESTSVTIKQLMEKYNSKINILIKEKEEQGALIAEKEISIQKMEKEKNEKNKQFQAMQREVKEKVRENEMLQDLLDHQRKDRTLRTVPSLASLPEQDEIQEENFKQFYNQAGQKEGQIAILQRQLENIKQQMEELKESNERKIVDMEVETTQYIQEIIKMKLVVAEAEMKASEKTHLYNQLKKRFAVK